MADKKVAIIIVTFNSNLNLLTECLNSLKKNTSYKNYKVIVSDNGSTNGSNELISTKYKWVDLIENKENIYWAGGNNSGIIYAKKKYNPDYFFLLNDDTKIIQRDWLSKLVATAESDRNIGIIGPKVIYPNGDPQHFGGYMKGFLMTTDMQDNGNSKIKIVDHVMGSAIMISKKVVNKIGIIDEIFTPYLLDETDYCLRAKKAGFKVVSDRQVEIIHHKGQTIDRAKRETITYARGKNDSIFSLIDLNPVNAFLRTFVYIPFVTLFKKRNEKEPPSIRNVSLRKEFFKYLTIMVQVELYLIKNWKMIMNKRKERNKNKRIWYNKYEKNHLAFKNKHK